MPEHTIAAHADDEGSMKHQSPIFSLSWGGPRRFVVRPKLKYKSNGNYRNADITLHSGDLLIMGGSLQQTHTHEVPKWRKTKDPYVPGRRINWTVRAFVDNKKPVQSHLQS
jgi:alkylated DNA repair dioxygenase AlkB